MKEIKFRGKVKWNGQHFFAGNWIEGFYAFKALTEKHFILVERLESQRYESYFIEVEVEPETVGQCMGIKDKRGNNIYGGDICKYYNTEDKDGVGVIYRDYIEWISGTIKQTNWQTPLYYLHCSQEWEVIGNIRENPELLNN